jgi:hypothetical protein
LIKLSFFILVLLTVLPTFQTKAEAGGGFSVGVGYGYYPRYGYGYGGYPYYRPYYRPYFYGPYWGGYYGGFYNPYFAGYYGGYPGYYSYSYFGEVRTEVKPKQATVYVDGAYVGTADSFDGWWQRLQLEPGPHRVVFRAPGYVPYAITIQSIPGQDVKIKQQLQPGQDVISDEEMRLSAAERKAAEGNGGYYDQNRPNSPPGNQGNPYNGNPYNTNPYNSNPNNNNPYNFDRNPAPPSNPQRNQDLSMEPGNNRLTLALKVTPPDATIYIDENYYGTADGNSTGTVLALLSVGTHKIEIVRPGYESFTQEIEVGPNATNKLDVQLQKK